MSVESERIRRIKNRWTSEHRISAADVEWLLNQADRAETFRAADSLRPGGAVDAALGDLENLLRGSRR